MRREAEEELREIWSGEERENCREWGRGRAQVFYCGPRDGRIVKEENQLRDLIPGTKNKDRPEES